MKVLKVLGCLAALAIIQGCAFSKASIKVAATPDAHVAGPLADVQPIQLKVPQLEDARADKARIGWKKNGFGQNTADITTVDPVDKIVEDAVTKALVDNHHVVGQGGSIQVLGTVDRFWFETDINFWTAKFIGDVQCTLDFVDTNTNKSIYKSKYSGNYSEERAGGLEKTWTIVMSKAVDKLIEDVVLDENLAEALRAVR